MPLSLAILRILPGMFLVYDRFRRLFEHSWMLFSCDSSKVSEASAAHLFFSRARWYLSFAALVILPFCFRRCFRSSSFEQNELRSGLLHIREPASCAGSGCLCFAEDVMVRRVLLFYLVLLFPLVLFCFPIGRRPIE